MPHSPTHHHAAHAPEHPLSPSQKRKAVFAAVLAAGIALASLWLDSVNRELLLTRDEASNMWAYFHEKALKERIYESELSFAVDLPASRVQDLQAEITRYQAEGRQIRAQAEAKEQLVKALLKSAHAAEMTAILLELAVVFVSLSLVVEVVWLTALAALTAGSGAGLAVIKLLF